MKWFSHPRRSFNSLNRRNRQRIGQAASLVARSELNKAEQLESRRMLVNYVGTAGADSFLIQVGGGNVTVTINGVPDIRADAAVASIVIDALGGNDTVTLLNNDTTNPTTINAGDGDDSIVIGAPLGGNYVTTIDSTVSITDGTGAADVLVFNDLADAAGNDTYTMTGIRTLVKPTSAATTWAGMNSVTVNGSPQASTYDLRTDGASGPVTVNGGAALDTFNVGDGLDLGNAIDTNLHVNGAGAADVVTLDDTTETTATTYTLDASGLGSTQMGGAIRVSFASISNLTLNGAPGALADTYNILDLNSVTNATLNAGAGNDTVNYSDGVANINTVDVNITFNGDVGSDRVNWNAQGATAVGVFTATSTQLDSTQTGFLNYATTESIVVTGSDTLAETFNVNSTLTGTPITVNGGDGNDSFNVGGGDLDTNLAADVSITGGLGVDLLTFDDTADTVGGDTLTLSSALLVKGVIGNNLRWDSSGTNTTDNVVLNGSPAAEAWQINSSSSVSSITLNGGDGNDTITFGNTSLSSISGPVRVNGDAGVDSLILDDAGFNVVTTTYTFGPTGLTRPAMLGSIDINGISSVGETVTLLAGTAGAAVLAQTFNVNEVSTNATLIIDAGDGNDTLNIGGGDWGTNILTPVSVIGGLGTDRIVVADSTDNAAGGDVYALNSASLIKDETGATDPISWSATEQLVIDSSPFADLFNIAIVVTTLSVTINSGTGNDTLTTATSPDDVDNVFTGSLFFNGGADTDSIGFSDSEGADGPENYTITGSSFSKTAGTFGSLSYNSSAERLNFTLDDDASLITVGAFLDGQFVTVNGGLGNDTIQNDASNNFSVDWEDVSLFLSGGSGTDSLDLDDSISAAPNYSIDANVISTLTFSVTGPMSAGYDLFENITILAGSAGSTINFIGADGSTNFTLNGGDGDDTINVGGAAGNDLNDGAGFSLVTGIISLEGGAGTDSLHFRDTDNEVGDDIYQLNTSTFVVGLGAANPITFNYDANVDRLAINGSNLASVYNLESTLSLIETTITGGTGADDFQGAPGSDDLNSLDALLTINGGTGGNDTLTLHDTANATAATWTITSTSIDRTGDLFAGITYGTLERIEINAGTAADTFNMLSSTNAFSIDAGNGADVYNVGGVAPGNTTALDGNSTLFGGAGVDVVNYNDQNNALVTTYNVNTSGVDTRVNSSQAGVVEVGNFVETLNINTGSANNTINLNSVPNQPTATSLTAGAGNDTINVGNGDFDSNILRDVSINSGLGTDSVVLNDSTDNDVGDTYTLTSATFVDGGNPGVALSYNGGSNTEFFTLNLPIGNETVNVTSSISGTTSISGGDGNDTVNAGNGDLDSLNGILNVDGGVGNDRFNLDNSTDPVANNNTINIVALSPALGQLTNVDVTPGDVAQWSNTTERVVITDGAANTTFNVTSVPTPATVSILGGDGNDTFNAGGGDIDLNLAGGSGPVQTFDGGNGNDVLNIDDSADNAGGDILNLTNSRIDKNGQFVDYTLFEALNIAGSPQATTYNVESINATTPTSIAGGGAADTFVVGNDIDAGILGALTVTGGGGVDSLTFNDTGDAADADTYTFTDAGALDTFIKTGSATVSFNVENATLDANAGNNPIVVNSMSINVLTLNGNSGNDNFQIADGGNAANPIFLTSGAGADTVQVDSDNDAVEAFARFVGTDEVASINVRAGSTLQNGPGNSTTIITGPAASFIPGAFDIAAGFLIARVGVATQAAWTGVITTGYNAGAWNGAAGAVNSSAAAASVRADGVGIRLATDPNLPGANVVTFGGQAVNPGDVLMGYMQNGDSDLDRDVDFDDLLRLAQNYGLAAPRAWTQGSFDYDNDVDFDDLLGLAQNYNLPFLRVTTSDTGIASARTALAEASQSRGSRVSRAMASLLTTLDKDDALFAKSDVIA